MKFRNLVSHYFAEFPILFTISRKIPSNISYIAELIKKKKIPQNSHHRMRNLYEILKFRRITKTRNIPPNIQRNHSASGIPRFSETRV